MTTISRSSTSLPQLRQAPSLEDAAQGNGLIKRGMTGDSVRQLQEQLNAQGANLRVDGQFGPATQDAVRRYQRANGLDVDGVVGRQTLGQMGMQFPDAVARGGAPANVGDRRAPTETERANPPAGSVRAGDVQREAETRQVREAAARRTEAPTTPTLAPSSMSEAQKYDHYAAIVRQNGGQVNPDGRPTVLGLRGLAMDGTRHASDSTRRYDDTFVVLSRDAQGQPHVRELRGATHPGQTRSSLSPDVTRDGVGDVGTIRPGNYEVVPNGNHGGAASYHVRTQGGSGSIPGYRDTNHDGRFTDSERAASQSRGDTLTGVLFHQGNTTSPRSIGCQTLAPDDYRDFMRAVGGSRGRFNFTLVDASGG
jgi:peptidoglycan hydrolase-like protein with peptidoglycan-binding domain